MYRNYLLKKQFWAKKKADYLTFIRHDPHNGGIYAKIKFDPKGVDITVNGETNFFNNFNKLDEFFAKLEHSQNEFQRILNRKLMSRKLRQLEI
ncbi:MAG: hypothetical protein KJI71_00495 [Patescibacteria group bacterium]|nr:hypothetical protein [Patescibacteria group bacterium]